MFLHCCFLKYDKCNTIILINAPEESFKTTWSRTLLFLSGSCLSVVKALTDVFTIGRLLISPIPTIDRMKD